MWTEPVLTYQDEREFKQLLQIVIELKPKRILEVGSAYGGTLYEWMRAVPTNTLIVSMDYGDTRMVNHDLWRSWAEMWGQDLRLVVGDSHQPANIDAVRAISPEYDFVFIDGDHSYEGSLLDWKNFGSMARKGGIVAFDDIKPNDIAEPPCKVSETWAEIKKSGATVAEIIGDRTGYGNGLGIVYR
jgi:cephalosporin hydroxylase